MAGLFWLIGLLLLAAPFLRAPAAPSPEGDDPARNREVDAPFAERVAQIENEQGFALAGFIEEASDVLFDPNREGFDPAGLFRVRRLGAGRRAYERYCVGCHGNTGDGSGPSARHYAPRPRNFRKGVFKYTSTETGRPPLRKDLFSTITRGLSGSSMPDFRLVSEETRWDLVEYVRFLAVRGRFEELMAEFSADEGEPYDAEEVAEIVFEDWSEEDLREVFPPIPETHATPEAIARGREIYLDTTGANCTACHGETGRGDGPSATAFLDHWGYDLVPRDLTTGVFRAGDTAAALYSSIATGINGTPMPSFADSITPEDTWALVHFIDSLRESR